MESNHIGKSDAESHLDKTQPSSNSLLSLRLNVARAEKRLGLSLYSDGWILGEEKWHLELPSLSFFPDYVLPLRLLHSFQSYTEFKRKTTAFHHTHLASLPRRNKQSYQTVGAHSHTNSILKSSRENYSLYLTSQ